MRKLWFLNLYLFGNLLAKTTDPVLNPRPEVEIEKVASSLYEPVYQAFSLDNNKFALRIVKPPSCGGTVIIKSSASGEKLYNESIAAAESIQNGSCGGAKENVIWSFKNIIWQEIPIESSQSSDQYSLVLSAEHPVNQQDLQCINDILYPPIATYKIDMKKCSDAHSKEVSLVLWVLVVLALAYYHRDEIASATRRCRERVCQRFSEFSFLPSNRRRRDSGVGLDDPSSPTDQLIYG